MKILMTGGSGILGQELQKIDPSIYAPPRSELDVTDGAAVWREIGKYAPDIVIHAAAVTDNRKIEKAPEDAIQSNIVGTANIALACRSLGIRLVYLSTDYIYKGDRGAYKETDEIYPFNLYSWTKLGGECSVRCCVNYLIIRTSFTKNFDYPYAFENKWFSKDYVDILGPEILSAAKSSMTGTVNIGTERKTVYELALRRSKDVLPAPVEKSTFITPVDTSFNTDRWSHYKKTSSEDIQVSQCRICGSTNLERYLDLGVMPLVNNLAKTKEEAFEAERYPLQVLLCGQCGLSQLSLVVGSKKMFSHYLYQSSISKSFVKHSEDLATQVSKRLDLKGEDLVVEIASNDGTLMRAFRALGHKNLVGVDPAKNLAAKTNQQGFMTFDEFWGMSTVEKILAKFGNARLIVGMNVFAHIHDVHSFLEAAKKCLAKNGRLILEFPYLPNLIRGKQFDTVYHEHLSYWMITPLVRLAKMHEMVLTNITSIPIHGGSIRVELGLEPEDENHSLVKEYLEAEERDGFRSFLTYRDWAFPIERIVRDASLKIYEFKKNRQKIYGFGASAKGCILLNAMKSFTSTIDAIIDDTPEKIGLYSPGTAIPIVSREILSTSPPDKLLILAWNFRDEIIESTRKLWGNNKPAYIIPAPSFELIEPKV